VVSRRALLAGGAVALLAGCGEDDDVGAPAPAAVALAGELRAERSFEAALLELPPPHRSLGRRLAARAAERARRLEEAGAAGEDAAPAAGVPLDLGRAAVVAHVGALPSLTERELSAELIVGASTDVAVLASALGEPADDAFPGTP
jgi:hypothetical protein